MEILKDINTWFWNEYFWLPSNITWDDISDTSYAQFADLNNSFIVALVLLVVRFILQQYVFSPIGQYLGIKLEAGKNARTDTTENKVLEKAFCENKRFNHTQVRGLAKQLDWSERRVDRWIRRRISSKKPTILVKFTEAGWLFTACLSSLCYGLYILWDKPWMWTTSHCWYEYPHHNVTDDIWWYYMLELGFYWSLSISQFWDTKRKDFLQILVHHVITVILLIFSWTTNFWRIGNLTLVILGVADILLQVAKMANYIKYQRVAKASFAVFTVVWIITCLVIYPYRVTFPSLYEAPRFPAGYMMISLLCTLHVLHISWAWSIVKTFLNVVYSKNHNVNDPHSDTDESIGSSSENDTDAQNDSSYS